MPWNKINCGFSLEEETIHFGTRILAQSDSNVYEAKTLATIEQNEENLPNIFPNSLTAYFQPKVGLCISLDNSFVILNVECNEKIANFDFDYEIQCFCVSEDGTFILLLLKNTELICLYIGETKQYKFAKPLPVKDNQGFTDLTTIHLVKDDILICSDKLLVGIKSLDWQNIKKACDNEDIDNGQKIFEEITCNIIEVPSSFCHVKCTLASLLIPGLVIFTSRAIIVLPLEGEMLEYPLPAPDLIPRKVEEVDQLKLLFCLTEDGSTIVLCPYTFTIIDRFITQEPVQNVNVFQSTTDPCILLHYANRLICLRAPDFGKKFDLVLNSAVSFPALNQNEDFDANDGFIFLEGFSNSDSSRISVRVVEEVQPEFRLERLLRRGKFIEAEKFAEVFGLDLELVYKAKASQMLQAIQPWTKMQAEPLENLTEMLDKINDIKFTADCCANAITPNLEMSRKLLTYSHNRLKKSQPGPLVSELQKRVSGIIMRLHTYHQLYINSTLSTEHWLEFSKVDLLTESHRHLMKGEVREAALIWSRHKSQLVKALDPQIALTIIRDIPDWVSAVDLLPWLRQFLPIVLINLPQLLSDFICWVLGKIRALELLDQEAWPYIGIQVTTDLFKTFQETMHKTELFAFTSKPAPLNHVEKFLGVLHSLNQLKAKHGIVMSYKEFTTDIKDVVFTVLDRAPVDKVLSLVKTFLQQMLLEHRLNSDVILWLYIQRIVQQIPNWCVIQEGLWEVRVAAVLQCIYNTQEYLESVLCIVKKAAVPWSKTIQSVVDTALSLKHPLTFEIREQYALIPEKLILKNYGCDSYSRGFNEDRTREMVLHILSVGKEEALQDALSLCRNTNLKEEVYYHFLFYCIKNGQTEKVDRVLNELDKDARNRIWYKIGLHLEHSVKRNGYTERIKPFLPFISLITNAGYPMQFLKTSLVLLSEYDVKIKSCDLSCETRRKEILEEVLQKVSEEESVKILVCHKKKLSRILELSPNITLLHLVKLILAQGNNDLAFELFKVFTGPDEEQRELIDGICQTVLEIFVDCLTKDLKRHQVVTLINIARFCIVESSCSWHLLSGAEILRWQRLLLDGPIRHKIPSHVHRTTLHKPFTSTSFISQKIYNFLQELTSDYVTFGRAVKNVSVIKCFGGHINESEIQIKALNRFHPELVSLSKHLFDAGLGSLCLNYITMLYYALSSSFKHPSVELQEILAECLDGKSWEELINERISIHLKNLVNSRGFDLNVALGLLMFFNSENSLSWLCEQSKSAFGDTNRQSSVLRIGMRYCELLKHSERKREFSTKHMLCTRRRCLDKMGIKLRDPFGEERKSAMQRLVKLPHVDLLLLKDFCFDVRLDFQECIHIYAQHILLSWEPIIEVIVDGVSGTRVMTVKNNADNVLNGLKSALSVVEDEERFVDYCAKTLWEMANCYYYEIFFVILDFLDYTNKRRPSGRSVEQQIRLRHRIILSFLNLYTRVNPPSQEEKAALYKACQSGNDSLPPIADFRLPFTRLEAEPLTVISPELNLGTYKIWFKLMNVLPTVNKNELCFRTIHKFCAENVTPAARDMEGEWCIHLCNGTLMSEIEECIGYITDMEIVCASYYYVLNNLPPGADQVKAAELCYENAMKMYRQKESDESHKKLLKVRKKYLKVLTVHVLHMHNLAQPDYLQLALSPQELITSLYQDRSIIAKEVSYPLKCPDINKAVDKIGALHQVDIDEIRRQLVKGWLLPDASNLDETIGSYFTATERRMGLVEEDSNLIRACYILSYGNGEESLQYLAKIVFNSSSSKSVLHDVSWPISGQLRALQCLLSIAPSDVIYSLTEMNPESIKQYMQELWFTCQLEQFGCVCSVESFESYNKVLLVEQLLETLSVPVAKIAVQLCLSYNIDHHIYWNTLIKYMVDNFMSQELKEILPALENKWHFLDSKVLSAAWNYVVISNLSKGGESLEKELKVKHSLDLIFKCPSPHLLNIESFLDECKAINVTETELPELSAVKVFGTC